MYMYIHVSGLVASCNWLFVCFQVRLDIYRKRKIYMEGMLAAESAKLDSQARFIVEKIEGKIVIGEYCSNVIDEHISLLMVSF